MFWYFLGRAIIFLGKNWATNFCPKNWTGEPELSPVLLYGRGNFILSLYFVRVCHCRRKLLYSIADFLLSGFTFIHNGFCYTSFFNFYKVKLFLLKFVLIDKHHCTTYVIHVLVAEEYVNHPGAAQIVDLILTRLNEVGLSRNFHVLKFLCHVVYRTLIKINIDDFFNIITRLRRNLSWISYTFFLLFLPFLQYCNMSGSRDT